MGRICPAGAPLLIEVSFVEEVFAVLVFHPFVALFHATIMVGLPPRNLFERILQRLTAGALIVSVISLAALTIVVWQRLPWSVVCSTLAATVISAYLAGLFASRIENARYPNRKVAVDDR